MAQGLEQAADAEAADRRAEEHRHDQALVHVPDQVGEHQVAGRVGVGKQLLHQFVVEIGKLLEHVETRVGLGQGQVGRQGRHLGRLARPRHEGALQGQVDIAGDTLVLEDLPRDFFPHLSGPELGI